MRRGLAIWLTVLLGASAPAAAEDGSYVGWLDGRWLAETADGGWAEENWSSAQGGVLVGTGKTGKGDEAKGFEFMRIAREGGRLVFYGSPSGAPAVAFREVTPAGPADSCQTAIVFENLGHDYPKRIAYRRLGDTLTATTSGDGGADMMTWTYKRVAVD